MDFLAELADRLVLLVADALQGGAPDSSLISRIDQPSQVRPRMRCWRWLKRLCENVSRSSGSSFARGVGAMPQVGDYDLLAR